MLTNLDTRIIHRATESRHSDHPLHRRFPDIKIQLQTIFRPRKNLENFFKLGLDFSETLCYYMQVLRGTTKYPGVAKFGIALEWGSRGLEFESRHSDHTDMTL